MLRDSTVVIVVVRTRPREIPLATHGKINSWVSFNSPTWAWGSAINKLCKNCGKKLKKVICYRIPIQTLLFLQ